MVDTETAQKLDYSAIYQLFPGHTLEDFPTHLTGQEAAALLTTATLAWHPWLLGLAQSVPQWHRGDCLPADFDRAVVLVPDFLWSKLQSDWGDSGCKITPLVCGPDRTSSCAQLRAWLELQTSSLSPSVPLAKTPEPVFVSDFFSLGYAVLQTLLMTKQLRYTSQLDWAGMQSAAQFAAACSIAQDTTATRTHLSRCFDLLLEEKNRYYPTPAQLLDIAVLPSRVHVESLASLSAPDHPMNLLVTGEQLANWQNESPELTEAIWQNWDGQSTAILGGVFRELPESQMPLAAVLANWEQGQTLFRQLTSAPPQVFARLTGSLHPGYPQLLREWNYVGALHSSFGGHPLPRSSFDYVEWQSPSLDAVPTLTRAPSDANAPETFLQLAVRCGEQIDAAHQATALLTHPFQRTSDWYQDLVASTKFGDLLGRWCTATEVLESLYNPGYSDCFTFDDYRCEQFPTNTPAGSLTSEQASKTYWTNANRIAELEALQFMVPCISNRPSDRAWDCTALQLHNNDLWIPPGERMSGNSKLTAVTGANPQPTTHSIADLPCDLTNYGAWLEQQCAETVREIAALLSGPAQRSATTSGWLLINPYPLPRRGHIDEIQLIESVGKPLDNMGLDQAQATQSSELTYDLQSLPASGNSGSLDLPSHGIYLVPSSSSTQPKKLADSPSTQSPAKPASGWFWSKRSTGRPSPGLVTPLGLQNEFFDIEFDQSTGGMRAIRYQQKRGNLLSQRLVVKSESANQPNQWRVTQFQLEPLANAAARAVVHGDLILGEQVVARFEQQVIIHRGSRQITIRGRISATPGLTGDRWKNYVAHQIAWNDETAPRFRSIHEQRFPLELRRFLSPQWIEIADTYARITLLPHGNFGHVQSAPRILDSLVLVPGECSSDFHFTLGFDTGEQVSSANCQLTRIRAVPCYVSSQTQAFRFVEISPNHVEIIRMKPDFDESGRFIGAEFWVKETAGIYSDVCLLAPRLLKSAWRLSLAGELVQSLSTQEDRIRFELQPFGLTRIQCQW